MKFLRCLNVGPPYHTAFNLLIRLISFLYLTIKNAFHGIMTIQLNYMTCKWLHYMSLKLFLTGILVSPFLITFYA